MPFPYPPLNRIALGIALLAASTPLFAQETAESLPKGVHGCVADAHTLCLDQGRFAVTAAFQEAPTGFSQPANAVPLTDLTGNFWFFDPANIELVVKVLDGCAGFDSFWFFSAGLTNLGVTISVHDLVTDQFRNYSNTFGTAFVPIQDTSAFHTCP
jgi:hypothetical protein